MSEMNLAEAEQTLRKALGANRYLENLLEAVDTIKAQRTEWDAKYKEFGGLVSEVERLVELKKQLESDVSALTGRKDNLKTALDELRAAARKAAEG